MKNYIQKYLVYCEIEKGLAPLTIKSYRINLRHFENFLIQNKLENLLPNNLTEDIIWRFRIYLSEKNLAKSSINYYLIAVRNLLKYLSEKDIKCLLPEKVKLAKKIEQKEIKILSIEEVQKLLEVINTNTQQGLRDRAIIQTFLDTGIRLSELVNLDIFKIENEQKETETFIKGKGRKIRTIYFSKNSTDTILQYLFTRTDNCPALFITKHRGKIERIGTRTIQTMIDKYASKAGLSNITPHSLRRFFAINLLKNGANLRIAQLLLGHSSSTTTEIYTKYTNIELKEAHEKYNKLFR
ncbi:MAG: tyrosine-type recombinase/integrase [Nanoarchaeota archaeon]